METTESLIDVRASRRGFLAGVGQKTLSAAAVAILVGRPALALAADAKDEGTTDDLELLGTALVLEHQAIAAYQIGADSGLLQKPILDVALQFQSDHKKHAEAVSAAITKLGGKPVAMRKITEYGVPVDKLKVQADVLRFAAQLEYGAAIAYITALPVFHDRDLIRAAGSILGAETIHWALLRNALGENPDPSAFIR